MGSALIVWTDFVCPFSYLAEWHLRRLAEQGVRVEHRPFELAPPSAPALPPPGEEERREWRERVLPAAAGLDAELRLPRIRPRTRKAHELAALAGTRGREPEVRAALFRAVFLEGRDIGRIDVLVQIAAAAGFEPAEAKVALDLDTFTDRIVDVEREALAVGVTGTPTFRAGAALLVGLHPYEVLLRHARSES